MTCYNVRVLYYFSSQTPEREFILKLSALEIYNETVVDLLNRESGSLRLLDDPEVLEQIHRKKVLQVIF